MTFTDNNHDHTTKQSKLNLRCTRPPLLTHAAAASSVPMFKSYDAERSQNGLCESAPDNHETGDTSQCSERTRAGKCLGVARSEKRDPNIQTGGRPTATAVPVRVHNNWSGLQLQQLQQLRSCYRWLLVQRVAVLRGQERPREQMGHSPGRRKKKFISTYHYGRQFTRRWVVHMDTKRS